MSNKTTVVRDFNGGLNIVDDDLNLNSSFQTLLDNVHRGIDSALSTRYGYILFADLHDGAERQVTHIDSIATQTGSDIDRQFILFTVYNHGLHSEWSDHITFAAPGYAIPGTNVVLLGVYGTIWHDRDTFYIRYPPGANTPVTVGPITFTTELLHDNHMLGGDILEIAYFNDFIVVVDTNGEMARIDRNGTKERIWDAKIAYKQAPLSVWFPITYASSDIFKGELIVCAPPNIPVRVDFTQLRWVEPLGAASGDKPPVCRYVRSVGRWLVMAGDPNNPYRVHISMTDAGGTWYTGDITDITNDATSVDVTNIASSSSSIIRGINRFREFCVVGFDDACVLLELGIFDGNVHKPDPVDTIVRHGTIAHKTMVYMGFDLLMADAIGIPGLAKSLYDNTTMPSRHSDFIGPMIQRNVARLGPETLADKCFAVYNSHDNRYIAFMPDFDDDQFYLDRNPFVRYWELPQGRLLVHARGHLLEVGNVVSFSGAIGAIGGIDASLFLTGDFTVVGVVNDEWFSIDTTATFTGIGAGGGTEVIITRRRQETTGYAYTYNKNLKIKSWSRYRGLDFVAGTTSVYGRLFLATKHRVWRMGSRAEPLYGDQINGFQSRWRNNTAYVVNNLTLDEVENRTYKCIVNHTSPMLGTFEQARAVENKDHWELFKGNVIKFQFELPWADFDKRDRIKILKQIGIDAKGTGRFTLKMFNDYLYKNRLDGTLVPCKMMEMVGGDSGGYGIPEISYGSGRIATRQRLWPWDSRGKLFKLRIDGETNEFLSIVAFIMTYGLGGTTR